MKRNIIVADLGGKIVYIEYKDGVVIVDKLYADQWRSEHDPASIQQKTI